MHSTHSELGSIMIIMKDFVWLQSEARLIATSIAILACKFEKEMQGHK